METDVLTTHYKLMTEVNGKNRCLERDLVTSLIIEAPEDLYSTYITDFMHLNCQHCMLYIILKEKEAIT